MYNTAKDLNANHKKSSKGGLAVRINIADC